MIGYLQGAILNKQKQIATVLCGPVGYDVHLSSPTMESLEVGQNIELFIHTRVREDDISLYGFPKASEMEFFRLLITVSGVGPKTALEILSADPNQVKSAIMQENTAFLSKIPGIGKKTAERIIVDLKNKVSPETYVDMADNLEAKFEEVVGALMGLGYQRGEIYRVLKASPTELNTTEEMVTFFLRNI